MSIRSETCMVIVCDDCGESGPFHFPSAEEARSTAAGGNDGSCEPWRITDDMDLCDRCSGLRECQAHGHSWGSWLPVDLVDGLERRFCMRYDGGAEYRRHGQPIDNEIAAALVTEARASARGGKR